MNVQELNNKIGKLHLKVIALEKAVESLKQDRGYTPSGLPTVTHHEPSYGD